MGAAGSAGVGGSDVPLMRGESSGRFHATQAVNAMNQAVKAAFTPSNTPHFGPLVVESSVFDAPTGAAMSQMSITNSSLIC